jgi:chemotaxis protein methyltransferase CheR
MTLLGERPVKIPAPPPDPVIENLHRRVEATLGIKAAGDALENLRECLEQRYGKTCFESPGFYERVLGSAEEIFAAARFVTINETCFFREEAYFDLLLRELLPRFNRLARPLRVCSAAASIGCEAYSLAMVMDYYSRTVRHLDFEIDAFDVNPEVIGIAQRGSYTGNSLRDDGARWRFLIDQYTEAEGQTFVVKPALQDTIRFYTHNLLDGLMGARYDLIFFRNALIYFSADKRAVILNLLADALFDGGFLVLGVSETPAVNHPLLASQYTLDAFYFQKAPETALTGGPVPAVKPAELITETTKAGDLPGARKPEPRQKPVITQPEPEGIAALLDDHPGAGKLPELFRGIGEFPAGPARSGGNGGEISGNALFAAVIYLLGLGDFSEAGKILSFIEQYDRSAFTSFLRGEYHYFNGRKKEAEANYKESADKNKAFWPAFYRLCGLMAEENRVHYEYRIGKALESIRRGGALGYEIFIGGFSPDYYRRALEKRLT